MNMFLGVLRYEFKMSFQRKSLLITAVIFTAFYMFMTLGGSQSVQFTSIDDMDYLFSEAGQLIFFMNLFYPVLAGIVAADRAIRDYKLGVREILRSTGVSDHVYVFGKYLGVVLSLIVVQMIIILGVGIGLVVFQGLPLVFLLYCLLSVIIISAPGLFFVTAFSLFCPLFMPVRVYQILYTGYWYWGNYLNPEVIPNVSNTWLNASGRFPLKAFFDVKISQESIPVPVWEGFANIGVMLLCALCVLSIMVFFIRYRESNI